jgi:UDP-N-acetylmuramoylalanine--D-glutamate ligase
VICGGRDKGLDYGPLAKVFSRKVKHAVLFGEARSLIHVSVAGAGYDCITEAGSLNDAVQLARNLADPGDVVMLVPVCSSFDMFQSFEDRGNAFKKIVKEMANQ